MRYNLFFILYVLAVLPHLLESNWWVSVISVAIAIHAYLALSGRIKKMTLKISGALSVIALAIVFYHFKTILGPEPATALLIILAALKLEELRTERDGVIYLLLLMLIVMYYLLFSQTILSTMYMIVMCISITTGFVVANTPKEHLKKILMLAPKLITKDLLYSLPIFIVLFIFFPRFSMPWAYKTSGESSTVGFSDNLNPGQMASLAQSQEPAFTAIFSHNDRPKLSELYWRGIVLSKTDGWNWTFESQIKNSINEEAQTVLPADTNLFVYQVQLAPRFQKHLFVLNKTSSLTWKNTNQYNLIVQTGYGTFNSKFSNITSVSYEGIVSRDKNVQNAVNLDEVNKDLIIPPPSQRMQEFVNNLKAKSPKVNEISNNLLNHFSQNKFQYSLTTPQMNTVDDFVFDKKIGFCEHFASAYAAIMRWSGVPARVVVGFQGGTFNEYSDFLLVRDQNAHSWVEIFNGKEWESVDPTYAVNSMRINTGSLEQAMSGASHNDRVRFLERGLAKLQMAYGALEYKYNQFMLNYNFEAQNEIFKFSAGTKFRRWILFALCLLGIVVLFFVSNYFIKTREKKDYFALLLFKIHSDLNSLGLNVALVDPISRTICKSIILWPDHKNKFLEIEEMYVNYRFKLLNVAQNKVSDKMICRHISELWMALYKELKIIIS